MKTLYVVTNLVNGKKYVGITCDFERRWQQHRSGNGSKLIYLAINKYGIDNIEFDSLVEGPDEWVENLEIRMIASLNTQVPNGYNLMEGGSGYTGVKHSEESRKKMSEAHQYGDNSSARKVIINNVEYDCMKRAVEALGVNYSTLRDARRRVQSDVFNFPLKPREVVVNGVEYKNPKEAADALDVSVEAIRTAKHRAGSNIFSYQPQNIPVVVNGIEYKSLTLAAKALGVAYHVLEYAKKKAGSNTFIFKGF